LEKRQTIGKPKPRSTDVASLSVVVVDRVRVSGEAIAAYLNSVGFHPVVVVEADEAQVSEVVKTQMPDLILVNSHRAFLPSIRAIRAAVPNTSIVAIGVSESADAVLSHAEAGIDALITAGEPLSLLARRLEEATRGEVSLPPNLAGTLLRRVADLSKSAAKGPDGLTGRELEVAKLLRLGLSNKEIAQQLGIGLSTVKNHVHNILSKLDVRSRSAVAALGSHFIEEP
jgi:DNA-binding NarL/FixJ family response regulator